MNTDSLATAIDGNDGNETTTLTITSNVEADALATAQLSGVSDSSIIESLQAHSIGINDTDINLIGEDLFNRILTPLSISSLLMLQN